MKRERREKIIELVKYSRDKRKLERTGTDGISVENVKLSDVIREHKDSSTSPGKGKTVYRGKK